MSAPDPNVWSGRALQENFDRDGGCAVLHQCIRPLIGAFCAPGHHGYQRACDLITGQASTGPFGSPVFACAGKTDPTNLSDIVGNFRPGAAAFPGSFPQEPQLGPRGEARGRVFPGCTSPEARRARYRLPIGSPALPP